MGNQVEAEEEGKAERRCLGNKAKPTALTALPEPSSTQAGNGGCSLRVAER